MDNEKYGIEALNIIQSKLASIVVRAIIAFKDGVDLSDLSIIPASIGDLAAIIKWTPQAINEAKDLDMEEIVAVFAQLLPTIAQSYKSIKG